MIKFKSFILTSIIIVIISGFLIYSIYSYLNKPPIDMFFVFDKHSFQEQKKIIKKYKFDLYKVAGSFQKKNGFSIYSSIYGGLNANWASDDYITNWVNFWVEQLEKHNPTELVDGSGSPLKKALLWDIKTNNRGRVRRLPKFSVPEIEEIRNDYINMDNKAFSDLLITKLKKHIMNPQKFNYYRVKFLMQLIIAEAIANKEYLFVSDTELQLLPSLNKIDVNMDFKAISDICKYSNLAGKISIKAKKAILAYYKLLMTRNDLIESVKHSLRYKCIIDVVKKYDLLHGKPKNGYYYPVNDMKIKVVAD